MSQQEPYFKNGLSGIALTGWQRYDHFAVLCELFPASFPSLAISLLAVSHGYFDRTLKHKLLSVLSCPVANGRNYVFLRLDSDPYLWDKMRRCMFPGSPFFRLTYLLHAAKVEAEDYIMTTRKRKGWLTEYNARRNYSLPLRVDELTADLPRVYSGLSNVAKGAADTMGDIFDVYTVSEWVEQKVYPYILELEKIQNDSVALKNVVNWESRPLRPLKDLKRLGVPLPDEL